MITRQIHVNFEHWRCALRDEWLVRYGSPHFEPSRARQELCARLQDDLHRVSGPVHLAFDRLQLLAANEAFPEAAVADPIADLEIWEEWNTGVRTFPYPGRYSRLALTSQDGKTSATSSVGVLGEIMAGLFAQVGISPWVIVRVVRRWPDFIFYTPQDQGRYAFVEAKAFTTEPDGGSGLLARVHSNLLGDCAVQAVQQLNADPFVKVWTAFTCVRSISPMHLDVTFVEFDCAEARRQGASHRVLPQALIAGLASRAIWQAASKLKDWELDELRARSGRKSDRRRAVDARLSLLASSELEELLMEAGPNAAHSSSRRDLDLEIEHQVSSANYPEQEDGKNFNRARESAFLGRYAEIRPVGQHIIAMRDLRMEERMRLHESWRPNWAAASAPLQLDDGPAWRCGGAVYRMG